MRLWSLHPRYLDRQGLTAGWREALLAQAVLLGRTKGYRSHPQLLRFREHEHPDAAVAAFLLGIAVEATARGYNYDRGRIVAVPTADTITVTEGQLDYEWGWLGTKLAARSPALAERWAGVVRPDPHPFFTVVPGPIAPWERTV